MPGLGDLIKQYRQNPDDVAMKKIGLLTQISDAKILVKKLITHDRQKLSAKYSFPANMRMAKKHKKAIRFGCHPIGKKRNLCPCCELDIHNHSLKICKQDTTAIFSADGFHLSSCVAFFFTFIKYLVIMLLIRILILDGFNMITNLITGSYCHEKCSKQIWSLASIVHKFNRDDLIEVTDILVFALTIVFLFYFLAYRRFQYKMYDTIDRQKQTQDDYTILVENIPILNFPQHADSLGRFRFDYDGDLDALMTEKIVSWVQKLNPSTADNGSLEQDYIYFKDSIGQNYDEPPKDIVKTISLCYNLSRLQKISELRNQLMAKHEYNISKGKEQSVAGVNQQFDTIPQQIQFLNQSEIILSKSFSMEQDLVFRTTHFAGTALISFKYQHYRDYIVFLYQDDPKQFQMKGSTLKITKASAPSDMIWKNIKISSSERRKRVILSFVILFVFLLFAFALLLGSDSLKNYFMGKLKQAEAFKNQQKGGINWASMSVTTITTLITLAINYVLQFLAYALTDWQKHQSKANAKSSLVGKLLASQFLNNAMIYLVLSRIRQEDKNTILGQTGLVYQISNLLILSGAIQIVTNFVNFGSAYQMVIAWFKYGRKGKDQPINRFQVNLNRQCEYIQFDIAQRYSYYLLQLYTVSFYAYIVPIVVPAVVVIFIVQYWVDKFNLFRRCSLFYEIDYNLSRHILKMAEASVLIMTAGALYFSLKLYDKSNTFLIVALIVSLVFVVLSIALPEKLERKIFQPYESCEKIDYDSCVSAGKFTETYWLKNPATMVIDENMVSKREVKHNSAATAFTLLVNSQGINSDLDEHEDQDQQNQQKGQF